MFLNNIDISVGDKNSNLYKITNSTPITTFQDDDFIFLIGENKFDDYIYCVDIKNPENYNLPNWFKNCYTLKTPIYYVERKLSEIGLGHLYIKKKIEVLDWDSLIKKFNITSINNLNIDTSEQSFYILNSILNSITNVLPKIIYFVKPNSEFELDDILTKLKLRDYFITSETEETITIELSSNLPSKIIFSSNDSRYLKYWKENSKLCSKILKITPVLLHITSEESDLVWDEFGLVKKIKYDGDTQHAAPVSRLFAGTIFPNELLMISDIDLLLFDRNFLLSKLKESRYYDVTILGYDAYDKKRPECPPWVTESTERFPMCYIVTSGHLLNKIMNIDLTDSLDTFINKNNFFHGLNSDEIIFTKNLLNSGLSINRVSRDYKTNFYLKDRIEKYMFYQNEVFKINLDELKDLSGYVEIHCADYDQFEKTIMRLLNIIYS